MMLYGAERRSFRFGFAIAVGSSGGHFSPMKRIETLDEQ